MPALLHARALADGAALMSRQLPQQPFTSAWPAMVDTTRVLDLTPRAPCTALCPAVHFQYAGDGWCKGDTGIITHLHTNFPKKTTTTLFRRQECEVYCASAPGKCIGYAFTYNPGDAYAQCRLYGADLDKGDVTSISSGWSRTPMGRTGPITGITYKSKGTVCYKSLAGAVCDPSSCTTCVSGVCTTAPTVLPVCIAWP